MATGLAWGAPIRLNDTERIVFYGDSITEQNRYTALVETYLVTRFPAKRIECFNFGWSGDTARGGNARWARDAAATAPTLVLVDFGMNDGAYGGFDPWILDAWLPPLRGILAQARAGGARGVLVSPSVTDPHDGKTAWLKGYNDTLAKMAAAEADAARADGVPFVDLFTPMRAALDRARAAKGDSLVPDGIHPDEAGGLLMAWSILRAFDPPRGPADLTLSPPPTATRVAVDLALPYLPFWTPWKARPALGLCSFTEDLNRFRLLVTGWPAATAGEVWLLADGRPVARLPAADLARGVDLAALDAAPWARAGRAIWELAERRNAMRFEAWRTFRLHGRDWGGQAVPGAAAGTPAAVAADREQDAGRALDTAGAAAAAAMRALAQPKAWRLELVTVPPWSRRAALPRVIEDFEEGDVSGINAWDESAAVASTTLFTTSGLRALRLDFDAARDGSSSAMVGLPCALDFSETPRIAVDAALLPGSLPAGARAIVTLTLSPEDTGRKKRKKDPELKPFEVRGAELLADGGRAVVTFDLGAAPPAVLARTGSLGLALSFTPTGGGRGAVVFDQLRAVR